VTIPNPFVGNARSGGGDFELPEPGSHLATIVALVDCGTHDEVYDNYGVQVVKPTRKAFLVFELDGSAKQDGTPFVLSKEYSVSTHERGGLRKLAETLRGKRYDDSLMNPDGSRGEKIDYTKLVGVSCIVNVAVNKSKTSGKEYAPVKEVTAKLKGQSPTSKPTYLDAKGKGLIWFVGMDLSQLPAWLPWVSGKRPTDYIGSSYESRGLTPAAEQPAAKGGTQQHGAAATPAMAAAAMDDEAAF